MSVGLWGVAEDDPARPAVVEAGGTVLTFGELAHAATRFCTGWGLSAWAGATWSRRCGPTRPRSWSWRWRRPSAART